MDSVGVAPIPIIPMISFLRELTTQFKSNRGDDAAKVANVFKNRALISRPWFGAFPVAHKDVLSTTQKSSVIFEYKCHWDSRYVGQTSQRLQDRIKQRVQQWLWQQLTRPCRSQPHRSCKRNDTKPDCDSAIGQHHFENDQCALNYDNNRFSILATASSSFHLNLSEAAYIKT